MLAGWGRCRGCTVSTSYAECGGCRAYAVHAQYAKDLPCLGECFAGVLADRAKCSHRRVVSRVCSGVPSTICLRDHHRQRMRHHIMHLPSDPSPFSQYGELIPLLTLNLQQLRPFNSSSRLPTPHPPQRPNRPRRNHNAREQRTNHQMSNKRIHQPRPRHATEHCPNQRSHQPRTRNPHRPVRSNRMHRNRYRHISRHHTNRVPHHHPLPQPHHPHHNQTNPRPPPPHRYRRQQQHREQEVSPRRPNRPPNPHTNRQQHPRNHHIHRTPVRPQAPLNPLSQHPATIKATPPPTRQPQSPHTPTHKLRDAVRAMNPTATWSYGPQRLAEWRS
ncbi:hypothetical protein GCM10009804_75100 [Kribbella hippodromi]|uniref:Uncharacterized protein n=1 Tax=Kribbella hippodromi TaxID=434347 RepID=A0ABP4QIU7_9ACTN